MPPTTGYSFGDIVLVPFPFTDQSGTKRRPAVPVLTTIEAALVVRKLGQLKNDYQAALRQALETVLG